MPPAPSSITRRSSMRHWIGPAPEQSAPPSAAQRRDPAQAGVSEPWHLDPIRRALADSLGSSGQLSIRQLRCYARGRSLIHRLGTPTRADKQCEVYRERLRQASRLVGIDRRVAGAKGGNSDHPRGSYARPPNQRRRSPANSVSPLYTRPLLGPPYAWLA